MFDRVFLGVSMVLFVLGISLPMFSLQKFFVVNDSFSLLGGVYELLKAQEFFLVVVIFGFSVLTPTIKFALSWFALSIEDSGSKTRLFAIRKLAKICKWSMADVFIIAILAATVKLGGLAAVKVHVGLLFFGGYAILSMILTHRLLRAYELQPRVEHNNLSTSDF
ncbi:hypothetical protein NBRC116583_18680 [Arenicella sp. 4NH20-0111]|uniref:paraquat-inducible protein A n=1 Tax=Arenicella sp. 4NH20-0111 TaxID=3127648 RepID=UPI0031062CE4